VNYSNEEFSDGKGRTRHGSPKFYEMLEKMADIHDKKSHDYASNENPFGNYHFAGTLSQLFDNPDDAGFVGRIGEKLFRLANLENNWKKPTNESIEDTEEDICVITLLWITDRRGRRSQAKTALGKLVETIEGPIENHDVVGTKDDNSRKTTQSRSKRNTRTSARSKHRNLHVHGRKSGKDSNKTKRM
jgi:hypothetical protein